MKIKELLSESPIDWIKKSSGWDRYQNVDIGKSIKKSIGWDRYQTTPTPSTKKQIQQPKPFDVKQAKSALKKIASNDKLYRSDMQMLSNLSAGIKNRSIKPSTVNPSQLLTAIKQILDGYDLSDDDRKLIATYLKEI